MGGGRRCSENDLRESSGGREGRSYASAVPVSAGGGLQGQRQHRRRGQLQLRRAVGMRAAVFASEDRQCRVRSTWWWSTSRTETPLGLCYMSSWVDEGLERCY